MPEENLNQNSEDQESKQDTESESEEATELDELFSSDETQESDDPKEEVKRLKEKVDNIQKGVNKFFSEQGRKVKEPKDEKKVEVKQETSTVNPVLKNLYLKSNPEATLIWDEVEKEAKLLNKDPFTLYESSSYFKGEAKARAEAKEVEEKSKAKINKPSSDTDFSKNIGDVKPEDVSKLPPSQKVEWIKKQAEKERMSAD